MDRSLLKGILVDPVTQFAFQYGSKAYKVNPDNDDAGMINTNFDRDQISNNLNNISQNMYNYSNYNGF